MRRSQAITALVASLPALVAAGAAWLQAESAKRSEQDTYQQAGESLGEQAEEIEALKVRLRAVETTCQTRETR